MSGRRSYYSSGGNLPKGEYDDPQGSIRESHSFEQGYDGQQGYHRGSAHQAYPKESGGSIRGMGSGVSRIRGSRRYEEHDDEPQYSKGGSNLDQEESDEEELGDEPQYSSRGSPILPDSRESPLSGLRGGSMPLGNQSKISYGSRQYENNNTPRDSGRGNASMVGNNSTGFGSSGMLGMGGRGRPGLINQMGNSLLGMGGRGMQFMGRDPRGFRGAINSGSNQKNRSMPNFIVRQRRQGRRNGGGGRQQLINIRQNMTTPMTAFGILLNGARHSGPGVNTLGFNPQQQQQQSGMGLAMNNKRSHGLGGNGGRQGFKVGGRRKRGYGQPQPLIPGEPFDEEKHGHLTHPVIKEHSEKLQKAKERGDLGEIAKTKRDLEVALEKLSDDRSAEIREEWRKERANSPWRTPRGPRQRR